MFTNFPESLSSLLLLPPVGSSEWRGDSYITEISNKFVVPEELLKENVYQAKSFSRNFHTYTVRGRNTLEGKSIGFRMIPRGTQTLSVANPHDQFNLFLNWDFGDLKATAVYGLFLL